MTGPADPEDGLVRELWRLLGGDPGGPDALTLTGPPGGLPSVFDVDGLAAATTGLATLAVAELAGLRNGTPPPEVAVQRRHASEAFAGEQLLRPEGWQLPPVWDPIAGVHATSGGYIRLHTNYPWHRAAALRVLGLPDDPGLAAERVAAAVRPLAAAELESRLVAEGGCAAELRAGADWERHPQGMAVAAEPVLGRSVAAPAAVDAGLRGPSGPRPLDGVRVLDLTRVIAGPVATRTLAAWGCDVLRIDPPGFPEVPAVLPEVTGGKRCAAVDLRSAGGRRTLARLLGEAHVLVHGLRPGALDRLGFGASELRRLNPALVVVTHDAYGWSGPWAGRRGFDSLVQFSIGIAAAGAAARGTPEPVLLPVQALDHGTGYLLAAAACRGLSELLSNGRPGLFRASLTGTARLLTARPVPGGLDAPPPAWPDGDLEPAATAWGPVRRVPPVGTIGGRPGQWDPPPGPLGRDAARFTPVGG